MSNRFGNRDIFVFGGEALAEYMAKPYYISHEVLEEELWEPRPGEIYDVSTYRVTISYLGKYYSELEALGYDVKDTSVVPSFWFGTNGSGVDLFTHTWFGCRTSLLIGLYVMLVTLSVGIVWGSISGYYGGTVDIVMERMVEIIGGIPWLVTMT